MVSSSVAWLWLVACALSFLSHERFEGRAAMVAEFSLYIVISITFSTTTTTTDYYYRHCAALAEEDQHQREWKTLSRLSSPRLGFLCSSSGNSG